MSGFLLAIQTHNLLVVGLSPTGPTKASCASYDRDEPVLRGRGGGPRARHLARTVPGAVCRADHRERRRCALLARPQARTPALAPTGPLLSSANSLTSATGGIVG